MHASIFGNMIDVEHKLMILPGVRFKPVILGLTVS